MVRQITQYRYDALIAEQKALNSELDSLLEQQRGARDMGDLSENEEYAIATKNVRQSRQRLAQIADELSDVEIVRVNRGPYITLGSKVSVTEVGENGEAVEDGREFFLDTHGNTITEGILGIDSPLGKEILNGMGGRYKIQTETGTVYYEVTKVVV